VSIDFLTVQDVLQIQEDQVRLYGGATGLRDLGMLQSAVAQPEATYGGNYLHQDIFHMAAAYLFHICGNHPFVDGNKRTAAAACLVFLDLNGYDLTASENDFEQLVWDVANGKLDKDQIRTFIQKHSKKI
jgi:death on curing protein